jgi:hypothetical protein
MWYLLIFHHDIQKYVHLMVKKKNNGSHAKHVPSTTDVQVVRA